MITVSQADRIGRLTLNRPEKLNALTTAMLQQLGDGVRTLIDARVAVIVVQSSCEHFCAGADLNEWAEPSAAEAHRMSRIGVDVFQALATAPVPTIAQIDGVAMGGGLELALACDLRFASTRARLGQPEVGLANLPSYGGIQRLVNIVGIAYARELLFTAQPVDGTRAAEIGLVNRAVAAEQLQSVVGEIVDTIVGADTHSVALAKALTGGSPIDGVLAEFTSQTSESRARKAEFLQRRARARKNQGASK